LIIFTKVSWPPEYFVVWIYALAISLKKQQQIILALKKNLNVGKLNKKQHFEQKIMFLTKTTVCVTALNKSQMDHTALALVLITITLRDFLKAYQCYYPDITSHVVLFSIIITSD